MQQALDYFNQLNEITSTYTAPKKICSGKTTWAPAVKTCRRAFRRGKRL